MCVWPLMRQFQTKFDNLTRALFEARRLFKQNNRWLSAFFVRLFVLKINRSHSYFHFKKCNVQMIVKYFSRLFIVVFSWISIYFFSSFKHYFPTFGQNQIVLMYEICNFTSKTGGSEGSNQKDRGVALIMVYPWCRWK